MDIEKIATSTVTLSISQCDYLSLYVSEGDREPSWDGHIYIHETGKKTKQNLKRVAVQIKGKLSNDLSKNKISYPVETTDMKNFLYDGGVVFFVVYINKNNTETKIYYTTLSPVKLNIYIKQSAKQKTKNIPLREFPTDNNRKATILLNFYEDCLKQKSFAGKKLPTLAELEKSGDLESISISVSGYGLKTKSPAEAFVENEIYMYAKTKGSIILQPIESVPEDINIMQQHNTNICVKGKTYYTTFMQAVSKERNKIYLGKSISFPAKFPDGKIQLIFKLKGNLKERIRDLEFILACCTEKEFTVGAQKFFLSDPHAINIESLLGTHNLLCKLQKVLDMLGVKDNLELDTFSTQDKSTALQLITAFIDKKPLQNIQKPESSIINIKFSNLNLIFAILPTEEDDSYQLVDFFKTGFEAMYIDRNGHEKIISQYYVLSKEWLAKLSNLDYNVIVADYERIGDYEIANLALLEMIAAYDIKKDNALYDAMLDFSDWLLSASMECEVPYEVRLLNKLQIVKRSRALTLEEISKLCDLVESQGRGEDILVGVYLLMDNQMAANNHFLLLTKEQQEIFMKYPIYKFWSSK